MCVFISLCVCVCVCVCLFLCVCVCVCVCVVYFSVCVCGGGGTETDTFLERCTSITHDSVELMNARTNQRRSDESSLKHCCAR